MQPYVTSALSASHPTMSNSGSSSGDPFPTHLDMRGPAPAVSRLSVEAEDGGPRKKRKKTLRACDHCRDKRLRCDYIPDHEPPLCTECHKRKLSCELIQPAKMDKRKAVKLGLIPPKGSSDAPAPSTSESLNGLDMLARCVDRVSERMKQEKAETPDPGLFTTSDLRMMGETCVAQLLAELQPSDDLRAVDQEFGHRRATDGSVRCSIPKDPGVMPPTAHLSKETVMSLLEHFINEVLPVFPVITPEELRSFDSLSPITLLSACVIAAGSRKFPYSIFNTVRAYWQTALAMSDVCTTSSLANLQALLIMTMSPEPHGATASGGGSTSFLKTGVLIRMAQDLGLHHAPASDLTSQEKNTRMRLWLCCVMADRWFSASFGHFSLIHLDDCYDYFSEPHEQDPYLVTLFELSELLNRALRAIDRVRLHRTTDEQLEAILSDFDAWHTSIPQHLQFAGPDSTLQGGLLHLMLVAFEGVFLRPFVKQNRNVPSHIHFRPSAARWFSIVQRSQSAIHWVFQNGLAVLDSIMWIFYGLSMAASVQFFAHTKSPQLCYLQALETVKQGLAAWTLGTEDGPFSTRQKVYKVAALLYHAAVRRHQAVAAQQQLPDLPWLGEQTSETGLPVPPDLAVKPLSDADADPGTPVTLVDPFACPSLTPTLSAAPALPDPFALPPPTAAGSSALLPTLAPEIQNEWQGWCDSLLSTEDFDFLNGAAWAALPSVL
ncbi:uncharacterized protein JCM10292_003285 [Rhodotorula paludigena]|uniref:uncharacterized protein n=1 Tax=Rhodotorula paludigena TaxID=86838 RepID=UPI003176D85B